MALLIVAAAFALGFTNRGWLVVPLAALLPGLLVLLGAFDDGEGVGTFLLASLLLAGLACLGLLLNSGLRLLADRTLTT